MAITYTNFLTKIRDYTEVDSNVLTDTIIQGFIRAVELDVAGKVDYDDLRKYATSTFTQNNRYLSLPADCMIVRSLQVIKANGNRAFLNIEILVLFLNTIAMELQDCLNFGLIGMILIY